MLGLLSGKELGRESVAPALKALREKLLERNVAVEIADRLCESVATSLEGKRVGTFSLLSSAVRQAMEAALTRILTPKRHIDVLQAVLRAREEHRPFSIVFCGVNGVGKSTNLSKVAFWLKSNGFSVLIAACDTFRSGAVEQLRVHATRLQVPLYEQGYGKDSAAIAFQAIQLAKKEHIDCVLIDTAGRMQDNKPLMQALVKLVNTNNPDLVLFVGEALVGNDGVNQLVSFNEQLSAPVPGGPRSVAPRQIDGIFLTKFDTVDNRVGAALSMVYQTGHPIVFVGVGQSYGDVRSLHIPTVVSMLLA